MQSTTEKIAAVAITKDILSLATICDAREPKTKLTKISLKRIILL